jgi:hypothetical protein
MKGHAERAGQLLVQELLVQVNEELKAAARGCQLCQVKACGRSGGRARLSKPA